MAAAGLVRQRPLKADDARRTAAAELTLRQSVVPIALVTVLFLWGFSYGLLDTLNKHFQTVLAVDHASSSGLQAAYFACPPLSAVPSAGGASPGHCCVLMPRLHLALRLLASFVSVFLSACPSLPRHCASLFPPLTLTSYLTPPPPHLGSTLSVCLLKVSTPLPSCSPPPPCYSPN